MADIHFIGGEKGGVGKSMMARILAQYFIDHELPFIGFDADKSHGALLRFYGEAGALGLEETVSGTETPSGPEGAEFTIRQHGCITLNCGSVSGQNRRTFCKRFIKKY